MVEGVCSRGCHGYMPVAESVLLKCMVKQEPHRRRCPAGTLCYQTPMGTPRNRATPRNSDPYSFAATLAQHLPAATKSWVVYAEGRAVEP